MLGEERAQRVLERVHKFGEDGQERGMRWITELIPAKEEILHAQEQIDSLRRRLYGPRRERYPDPDPTEIFDDTTPEVQAPVEEEVVVKKTRTRRRG